MFLQVNNVNVFAVTLCCL